MNAIRVAVVEDSKGLRESLAALLNRAGGMECTGAFGDAEKALENLPSLRPDVVLMDIGLPGMSGVECVRKLKALLPETQIMMLTIFEDYERIFLSLRAGATGYLLKESIAEKLCESIRDLHTGGSPMSNSIARKVVLAFRDMQVGKSDPKTQLSNREQEILDHLARGHLYKEIADELNLSYNTVRTHVQNIYRKLHIGSKQQAARRFAARNEE